MLRILILSGLFFFSAGTLTAQTLAEKKPHHKRTFYLAWGYNKDWFSKSDIHFSDHTTGNYDFTLHDVEAHDRPSLNYLFNAEISIPQYCYRIGYYLNEEKNFGMEINFDHAKYIVNTDQTVHITGYIGEQQLDKDTTLNSGFLLFEHTNGANFMMINIFKRTTFFKSKNQKHELQWLVKAGAGVVIPKTDVTLFGARRDNVFHVAGYITGIDAGLRYKLFSHFFLEPTVKGCFANYTNVLTIGSARANHHFFSFETILTGGIEFPL